MQQRVGVSIARSRADARSTETDGVRSAVQWSAIAASSGNTAFFPAIAALLRAEPDSLAVLARARGCAGGAVGGAR